MMLRLRANVVLLRSNGNMTFKNKVKKYIIEKELVESGDRVLCALSGGGDSVALLIILAELTEEMGFTLCAAHFHHGIRGEEADRDQSFSETLCKELNVPFFTAREDIPRLATESGKGLEECARERRYAFLFGTAQNQKCNKIATAHHSTDNTETVLFHLLRGAGVNGLGGIAPKRSDGVIRPLLCVSKAEVEDFLRERDQKFVTDSTNADTVMTRNFIRLRVLPLAREISPSVDKAVSRLSDSAREDEEYFVTEAKKIPTDASLSLLRDIPAPILKRYIRLRLEKVKPSGAQIDYDTLSAICRDVKNGVPRFRYSVCGCIAVIGDRSKLDITADKTAPEPFCFTVDRTGEYKLENGTVFVTESETEIRSRFSENPYGYIAYPAEGDSWSFTVRSRREGDRYLRGGIRRAARKELNAVGYPAHKRDSLPCFCDEDGIFWIPPLKAGDKVKNVKKENSQQLIYIGYTEN